MRQNHITERHGEPEQLAMPSRVRRVTVIVLHSVFLVSLVWRMWVYFLTPACLFRDQCTPHEDTVSLIIEWVLILGFVAIVKWGWDGKLFGARKRGDVQSRRRAIATSRRLV